MKLPHVAVKDAEMQLVHFLDQGIMRRGTTGHRLRWLEYRGWICAVTFSRDSRFLLATSFSETVDVWDVDRAEIVLTFSGHSRSVYSVAVSPAGSVVASGDGEPDEKPGSVLLWDFETGKELHRFAGAKRGDGHWWTVTELAFSPDGTLLASCSLDGEVKLWDLKTRELVRTFVGRAELNCLAFDSEGRRLAAGGGPERPGWIGVWDVQTGRAILDFNGHRRDVTAVLFAPGTGSLISSSMDGTVRVWDPETKREIRQIRAHEGGSASMALSTDGRLLVTAGDQVVKFWSVDDWREVGSLIVHHTEATRVAISPDGRWLASVHGYNGELALHRLEAKDFRSSKPRQPSTPWEKLRMRRKSE